MKRILSILMLLLAFGSTMHAQGVAKPKRIYVYGISSKDWDRIVKYPRNQYIDSLKQHGRGELYEGTFVYSFPDKASLSKFVKDYVYTQENKEDHIWSAELKLDDVTPEEGGYIAREMVRSDGACDIDAYATSEFLVLGNDSKTPAGPYHTKYFPLTGDTLHIAMAAAFATTTDMYIDEASLITEGQKSNFSMPGVKHLNQLVEIDSARANTHKRVRLTPYVLVHTSDSVPEDELPIFKIVRPIVLNGEKLDERLGPNHGFNREDRDEFYPYTIMDRFMHTGQRDTIRVQDNICTTVENHHYPARCLVEFCDLEKVLESYDIEIDDGRDLKPLRFLHLAFDSIKVDYARHEKYGERQTSQDTWNTNLFFKISAARLYPDDVQGLQELSTCITKCADIVNERDFSGIEFTITGYASPDGNQASNVTLAKNRAAYLRDEIRRVVGATECRFKIAEPVVLPWTAVADTLWQLGYKEDSEAVLRICRTTNTLAMQEKAIRNHFGSRFKPLLEEQVLKLLRFDRIDAHYNINRVLPADEIVRNYYANPELYTEQNKRPAYEYYVLMKYFNDSIEKVGPLARTAYLRAAHDPTFQDGFKKHVRPWSIAAYHYARYLRHIGQPDSTIMKPYIRNGKHINFPSAWDANETPRKYYHTKPYGENATYNEPAMTLMQVNMLCAMNDFFAADSIFINYMDNTRFKWLRYYFNILQDPTLLKAYDGLTGLANTSIWNRFVVYTMQDNKRYDDLAWTVYRQNPGTFRDDDPEALYLKALLMSRLYSSAANPNGTSNPEYNFYVPLYKAFELDERYLTEIMRWDGYFKKQYYQNAKKAWDERKKKAAQQKLEP